MLGCKKNHYLCCDKNHNCRKNKFTIYEIVFKRLSTLAEIISIPIANTKNPIIFESDFNPASPVYFKILGAIEKITKIEKATPTIANIIDTFLSSSGYSIHILINNEIEPGPANNGIARGLKEISSFSKASYFIFPFTSRLCFALSNKKPDREMMIPPAIFNAFMDIPKKPRM